MLQGAQLELGLEQLFAQGGLLRGEFVLCLGYKGHAIKDFFINYQARTRDVTVDLGAKGGVDFHASAEDGEDWQVTLADTGEETLTGGRVKRLKPYIGNETFMLTWGDGVADVNINDLIAFHRSHGKLATITAVRPPARYGHMRFDGDQVTAFEEKPQTAEGWINGAFFVLEPEVFDYIEGDMVMFEHAPLENLAKDGQLMAYRHEGFWSAMDTLRDKHNLQKTWETGNRPWALWEK